MIFIHFLYLFLIVRMELLKLLKHLEVQTKKIVKNIKDKTRLDSSTINICNDISQYKKKSL